MPRARARVHAGGGERKKCAGGRQKSKFCRKREKERKKSARLLLCVPYSKRQQRRGKKQKARKSTFFVSSLSRRLSSPSLLYLLLCCDAKEKVRRGRKECTPEIDFVWRKKSDAHGKKKALLSLSLSRARTFSSNLRPLPTCMLRRSAALTKALLVFDVFSRYFSPSSVSSAFSSLERRTRYSYSYGTRLLHFQSSSSSSSSSSVVRSIGTRTDSCRLARLRLSDARSSSTCKSSAPLTSRMTSEVKEEREEKIEVPEGLRLNAVRMIKTAYETCAKTNNKHHQTITKGGNGEEKMPAVISEEITERFVLERIESERESNIQQRREYLKSIAEDAKLASKLIALDFDVCKRALVEGTMTLREVAERARRASEEHAWRKTVIRSVHEKLRDGAEANEEDLQQYSRAAAATGKSKWVKNALTWSFEFFEHYFGKLESEVDHDGDEDVKQYAKSRRKLITSLGEDVGKLAPNRGTFYPGKRKRDVNSEEENEESAVEMRNASIDRKRRYGRANRSSNINSSDDENDGNKQTFWLLDVGSCWDFYREYERKRTYFSKCKVAAFDLAPENGADDVLEGDFLDVQFFDHIEDGNGAETLLKKSSSSSKRLVGLKLCSFNIVVLSLVLTYVPTPESRFQMIINARKCLKGDGDGLLMIIEPHGFDKSKENLVAKTWQKTIESVGFEALVNSKTRDGLHLLIFKTSSLPSLSSERKDKLVMALDEEYTKC